MRKIKVMSFITLIIISLIILTITKQNMKLTPSEKIYNSVSSILEGNDDLSIFTNTQLKKIKEFKNKLKRNELHHYDIEAFQADDENIVQLMIISRPQHIGEKGFVLYMSFSIIDTDPLVIDKIIISNWVKIEYDAKQF